jgi:endonuclease III
MNLQECMSIVHERLVARYGSPQWHDPLSPIDQLISTILSQNTNDRNRDRAYNSLRRRFSTWAEVRDAEVSEVIEAVRTAGLANRKAPRIQSILRRITELQGELDLDFLTEMPVEEARQWLMDFNGVGPKTAAIVLQFSLGKPAFPVDTHIFRVTKRLGLLPEKMNAENAHKHLEQLLPVESYYPAHLNLIRLGRELCHPRRPDCEHCPLTDLCKYYALNVKIPRDVTSKKGK